MPEPGTKPAVAVDESSEVLLSDLGSVRTSTVLHKGDDGVVAVVSVNFKDAGDELWEDSPTVCFGIDAEINDDRTDKSVLCDGFINVHLECRHILLLDGSHFLATSVEDLLVVGVCLVLGADAGGANEGDVLPRLCAARAF